MKKIISIVSVAIILTALIAPAALAANPRFNFEAADLKTLSVANRTTNSGWQNNSVSANSSDQVAFQVYYRNGVADTIARNTRVRLNFPIAEQNYISVNVSLSADNAATVIDNVTINSAVAQKLVFDAVNIYWYPDQSPNATTRSATASGSGYIELNIGDIGPCWEHQGYVTFYASLVPAASYSLSINKNVRNISLNQTDFYDTTNASSGDQLEFEIRFQNTGTGALSNVLVSDSLPTNFSYLAGSTRVNGNNAFDGVTGTGLNIGSLNVGATATVIFRATINSCYDNQTLTNYGYVQADQVYRQSDTATVKIVARTCAPGNPVFRPAV